MSETIAERYFRSWERDGRRQLDAKLALAFETYDEQRTGRLSALDWKDHHATYDDAYDWTHHDRESGAWTTDYDPTTVAALRERDITVPETPPVALDVTRTRQSAPPRTCQACDHDRLCSPRDVEGAFPGAERGTAMQAFLDSTQGTHICTYCRRIFEVDVQGTVEDHRAVGTDLSEAM